MISTTEIAEFNNRATCVKLGVDEFFYDFEQHLLRKADEIVVDTFNPTFGNKIQERERRFSCPIIKWRIGSEKFSAAVPVKLKTERHSSLIGPGVDTKYDWPAMEKEVVKLVETSKKAVAEIDALKMLRR